MSESTNQEIGPLLMALKDAALVLGLSEWQVRGLTEDGDLPVTRVRGRIYIPAEAVRGYVAKIAKSA